MPQIQTIPQGARAEFSKGQRPKRTDQRPRQSMTDWGKLESSFARAGQDKTRQDRTSMPHAPGPRPPGYVQEKLPHAKWFAYYSVRRKSRI